MTGALPPLRDFLAHTPFFGGLDEPSTIFLTSLLKECHFHAGSTVVNEGEKGRSMYIVREGCLHVMRTGAGGKPVKLRLLHAGDFFGVTSLTEMEPRPFTVLAEQEATLLELTCADLHRLYRFDLKAYSLVLMNVNRELCRHLRSAAKRIAQLTDAATAHHDDGK
jgi:CRP-like cAMP-binding protein